LVVWLGVAAVWPGAAWGQGLPAAAGPEHLFVADADAQAGELRLLHLPLESAGGAVSAESTVHALPALRGRIGPGGLAASSDGVWVIYRDQAVRRLEAVRPSGQAPRYVYDSRIAPPLPAGASPLAAAGDGGRLWVLVRIDDPAALASIDGQVEEDEPEDASLVAGAGGPDDEVSATQPEDAAAVATTQPVVDVAHRLIWTGGSGWRSIVLPERAWPAGDYALLVRGGGQPPSVLGPGSGDGVWRVDHPRGAPGGGWRTERYELPGGRLAAAAVQDQVVVARRVEGGEQGGLVVRLWLLWGGSASALGELTLPVDGGTPWAVVPVGGDVAVVALPRRAVAVGAEGDADGDGQTGGGEPAEAELVVATMSLSGQSGGSVRLTAGALPPAVSRPKLVLMVVLLGVAGALVATAYRRGRAATRLDLPANMRPASFFPRVAAGTLDTLVGVAVAWAAMGTGPAALLAESWPIQSAASTWTAMLPGAVAIAVTVLHTTVSEVVWSQTLGKRLLGLRAVGPDGSDVGWWRAVVRGLTRPLELMLPWLLLVMVVGPNRQRLGELATQTLVVEVAGEGEGSA
jgi:uncharacterized RDD family membrane protein YckC